MKPVLDAGNPESWAWLRQWMQELRVASPAQEDWDALLEILDEAAAAGLRDYFRAGQTLSYLVFSTLDEHGLGYSPRPPFVTLGIDDSRIFVAWMKDFTSSTDTEGKEYVTRQQVLPVLKRYLTRLWIQTKPGKELPRVLA